MPHKSNPGTERNETCGSPVDTALPTLTAASSRKLVLLLVIALTLLIGIHYTPLGELLKELTDLERTPLSGGGGGAAAWFVLLTAGLMSIGMPRLVFFLLGGVVFGFWHGLLLALTGSLIGSFIAFRLARWGGRDWLAGRFGESRLFGSILATKPTAMSVALVRMLPVSNIVLNIGLSVSNVGNRAFLLGTLLGFLPQGVVAVLIGSGVGEETLLDGVVYIGFAAILLLLAIYWSARRLRAAREGSG